MSIGTLIILYALAGTIEILTGCFVAAWIWLVLRAIGTVIKILDDAN